MSGIHMALMGSVGGDVVISITDQTLGAASPGAAYTYYFLTSAGQVESSVNAGGSSPSNIEQWCTPTSQASNYEARVTVQVGSLSGGSGSGSWLALSSTLNWYVDNFSSGTTNSCTILVEIRRTGTGTVLDSATIILNAEVL